MGPVIGLAGLAAGAGISFMLEPGVAVFFQAGLYAFWIMLGLSLGSLALIMIHHMTAGAWSFVSQRIFEAFMRALPIVALGYFCFILSAPFIGANETYDVWLHTDSAVVLSKAAYLNKWAWIGRGLFYFAVWFLIVGAFNRWSKQLEETGDALITLKFRKWAPVGLIAYCLTVTFAAVDWGQSLEPEWFSTMYAPLTWISQTLTVFAVTILILSSIADQKPLSRYITVEHYHTLGTFMCGFIVIWAYMSFSQYLIIWAGNLPEEIHYYLDRTSSTLYNVIIGLLMLGHFFFPFLILLQRKVKYNIQRLRLVCYWVLAMRLVDIFFIFNPAFHHGESVGAPIGEIIVYACVLVGFGSIYFWYFLGQLSKMSLLPTNDPRLYKALGYGGEEAVEHG